MGLKCRSLHVLDADADEVGLCLAGCQMFNAHRTMREKKLGKLTAGPGGVKPTGLPNEVAAGLQPFLSLFRDVAAAQPSTATFYLVSEGNHISVVSEYLDSHLSRDEIAAWFAGCKKAVLIVDCLDGDVLRIDVWKSERFLSPYITGACEENDCKPSEFSPRSVPKLFGVTPAQLRMACDPDPQTALRQLSTLFHLPLGLKVLDVAGSKRRGVEEVTFYL